MAYDPSIYDVYNYMRQQPQMMQQQRPINGLVWVDGIEGAKMYPLPPNSISPTLLFKNEAKFAVKATDAGGAYTIRVCSFIEDEPTLSSGNSNNYVTQDDLAASEQRIMEAINGKPSLESTSTEHAAEQQESVDQHA